MSYQYGDDSTYKSEQRVCRFPHLPSNRDITEVAEGSAQQVWSEQRVCRFPPSVETEAVSASRKTHTIHQTSLNRGPDHPTSLRIGRVRRLRKVQYGRLGVSRGAGYPLPTEPERMSTTRKTHSTAQTSLSRGPDYPTFTRIEAASILQKAQIGRAVHPFSTEKSPRHSRRS